jgi:hypothetical protein
MPNTITIDGIILNTWAYDDQIFARMVHYDEGDERGYYNLAFPETLVVREVDGSGNYVQRRTRVQPRNRDRLAEGRPLVVTGRLMHRDERVDLSDFLRRAKGSTLTAEEQAGIEALTDKAGVENRAVVQIAVEEVVYL